MIPITGPNIQSDPSQNDASQAVSINQILQYQSLLLETVHDAVIGFDPNFVIRYWNKTAHEVYGWTAVEAIGKQTRQLFLPEAGLESDDKTLRLLAEQGKVTLRTTHRRKDGQPLLVKAALIRLASAEGDVQGYALTVRDITEQERLLAQVEQQNAVLEQQQNLLLGIIEGTQDLIAAVDNQLRFTAANEAYRHEFKNIFGREVAIGDNLTELLAHLPEDQQAAVHLMKRALQGETFTITQAFGDPNLERKVFEMRFGPIYAPGGQIVGAAEIASDATERVLATEALRESEQKYRELSEAINVERGKLAAAIDNLPVGVGIGDAQGTTLSMNRAGLQLHGFASEADMFSRLDHYVNEFQLLTPDGAPMPVEDWPVSRAMRGEYVQNNELVLRNIASRDEKRLAYSVAPVKNSEGETILIVYVIQDLTERRQAEDALAESARAEKEIAGRFEVMANNISQLAWMADAQGAIFWYNQRWFDFTGTTLEQMQGWDWQKVLHPEYQQRVDDKIRDHFQRGVVWEDTFPLRGSDGQYRWFLSRAMPIRDEHGLVMGWFGTNTDITEQLQLQNENRVQKEMLERIIQTMPAGVAFLRGPRFVYTVVNDEYRRYAAGKGELIGHTVAEKWPEVADSIIPQMESVYQSGQPFSISDVLMRIQHGDTTQEHHFTYSFTPLHNGEDQVEGIMILAIDTTEQVRARQAIETERAQLATVLQTLPVGVWIIDETGRAVMTNQQADKIWAGKVPLPETYEQYNEYRGWWAETGQELKGSEWPISQALIQNRTLNAVGVEIERFDGTRGSTLISASPVLSAEGRAVGAVAVMMDITENKEMERLLRESEAYLQQMLASLPGLVWTTDAQGHIDWLSKQWLEYTGIPLERQLGEGAFEVLHPEDHQRVYESWRAAAQQRQSGYHTEYRLRRFDGAYRWFKARGTPIHDEEGNILRWFGISIDIDDVKQAEEALKQYADRLTQSNQDLQNFAFIASHDLQEPLRKIMSFSELIDRSLSDQLDESSQDLLRRMRNAAQRMQDMIRDLLELSRVSTHGQAFVPVNLMQTAGEVLSDLENLIYRTQGQVIIEPLPQIEADPLQMRQLLQNFIANALKFHQPDTAPMVRVSAERHNGVVTLKVEDNGIGFEEQYLDRILEPFQRLHGRSDYEGTGMGLAICKRIIDRHRGEITARSSPGEGTTFLITLPVRQREKRG